MSHIPLPPSPFAQRKAMEAPPLPRASKGWVTMGGSPCPKGEHCGGTHVDLDAATGEITKGPKGTVGKKPSQLSKKPKPSKVKPSPLKSKVDKPEVKPSPVDEQGKVEGSKVEPSPVKPQGETEQVKQPEEGKKTPHVTGTIHFGEGPKWKGAKLNKKVVYTPSEEDRDSPLFRKYGEDEKREPLNVDSLPKSFVSHYEKVLSSLSAEERQALTDYTGSDYYGATNFSMRKCPETLDCLGKNEKFAKMVDQALAKCGVLAEPINVYRRIGLTKDRLTAFEQAMEEAVSSGEIIKTPGFKSTSVAGGDKDFGSIQLEIRARTGAYIAPLSNLPGEEEFLQSHNTQYKVTGIKTIGGVKTYQLEEVLPS